MLGAFLATQYLGGAQDIAIADQTIRDLKELGVEDFSGLMPAEIFNWSNLLSLEGFFTMVLGGFLVGFGTRYAGGCTSGHSIMGLSGMQLPSLIATISFFVGGIITTYLFLPLIIK